MGKDNVHILVVDDEEAVQQAQAVVLELAGYKVTTAGKGLDAIEKVRDKFYNVVMLDIKLPDINGFEVLKAIREIHEDTMVIIMTAYGSLDISIDAMNKGAYSYIFKPFNAGEALIIIEKCLEKQKLAMENKRLSRELEEANKKLEELESKKQLL